MRIALLHADRHELAQLAHSLGQHLSTPQDAVACARFERGAALRSALHKETFDLLVLDWDMPDLGGVELLHWLRTYRQSPVPVIVLSDDGGERKVIEALEAGADDHMPKPARSGELCARARRLMVRRAHGAAAPARSASCERFGDWIFDGGLRTVRSAADASKPALVLTDREFSLALTLFQHIGHAVSRSHLQACATLSGDLESEHALDNHIYRLRQKLQAHGGTGLRLQTLYGHGYRLIQTATPR